MQHSNSFLSIVIRLRQYFYFVMWKSFKLREGTSTSKYSQTCVQQPPLGPEKSGRLKEVPDKI
jgi:hypothetical protein